MSTPLVTVVCLCYNQSRFVREAILSVMNQSYPQVQLIVVDDASTDNSVQVINDVLKEYLQVSFIVLPENLGNCKAFNSSRPFIKGEFVIDLAADDVLLPDCIEESVKRLTKSGEDYGIHFSDAEYISEDGKHLGFHSKRFPHDSIPTGNVYAEVIERYFICPPTVMIRKHVLDALNGYDELLAYEDFDLWIRASRDFKFCYSTDVLVKKRMVSSSLSQSQFSKASGQLRSTFKVCEKILVLNRTRHEKIALRGRIIYEMGVALRAGDLLLALRYVWLGIRNEFVRF
jgi:glycosyltransferase involved in cell wall biosynthesis